MFKNPFKKEAVDQNEVAHIVSKMKTGLKSFLSNQKNKKDLYGSISGVEINMQRVADFLQGFCVGFIENSNEDKSCVCAAAYNEFMENVIKNPSSYLV